MLRRWSVLLFSLLVTVPYAAQPADAPGSSGPWDVREAGAAADGQTDCTATFQKLLDAAGQAGGGVVNVPAGRYRLQGHLAVPENVTLSGVFRVPPTPTRHGQQGLSGSVLLAYEGRGSPDGPPFVRLKGNNASVAGLIITYPEWKQTDVPPVPYPPCIASENTENVGVRDCCLLNPYEGIKLVRAARHLVRNVTGYTMKRGIYVDECYDIGHIENVHFWPFGVNYQPDNPFCRWVNTNGVAFELSRTDWHYVHNTFCFGYGIGYLFSQSAKGSANGNFLGLGADSCQRAVVVAQAQPPGLLISNGEFVGRWSSTDAVCLDILPGVQGKVSLVNCSFWGPIDRCVWMRAPAGQFTASACHFCEWDNRSADSPAIQLDAGKAIVQGCTFNQEKLQVAIGSNVLSAILTANQAAGGFQVVNDAGRRTQMSLNEEDSNPWTEAARAHYQITMGRRGDSRFLEHWHGQEKAGRPVRWSQGRSRLRLPVNPGQPYSLDMEVSVPTQALAPDAGLYLGGKQIVPLTATNHLSVTLPPSPTERLTLELRCHGWVPKEVLPGSQDPRTLGIQAFKITMREDGSGAPIFDANSDRP